MTDTKDEFTTTVHYIGQEFSPPNPSYKFVSGQIVSHDDFKQETYIYVTWKKTASDENGQMELWNQEENGEAK